MKLRWSIIAAVLLLPVAVRAQNESPATSAPAPMKAFGGHVAADVHESAVIESLNRETREITLRSPKGKVETYKAGPDVRNFDQMKAGDRVDMVLSEKMTIVVTNAAVAPERKDTVDLARAAPGEKPGVVITRRSTGAAVIEAIDYAKRTATLKGPNRTVTIEADPEAVSFSEAKVGDRVLIDFVQTVVVTVTGS